MGLAGRGRGHALRRLRLHRRRCAAESAGRDRSAGQRREQARARGVVGRGHAALALVRGLGRGRLPAASRRQPAGEPAARARTAHGALALAGLGLLHDAGHDVRLPGLHRQARRHDGRRGAAAALGLLGAHAARLAVLLRSILSQRLARPARGAHRHGPARGLRRARDLRRQQRRHLRQRRAAGPRGLFRLAHDVRLLPSDRALAGGAPARAHRRIARGPDAPASRQRGAVGPRRQLGPRGRARARRRRRGPGAPRRGVPGRWRGDRRRHQRGRGPAHRRITPRAAPLRRPCAGRQPQPVGGGPGAHRIGGRGHALCPDRATDGKRGAEQAAPGAAGGPGGAAFPRRGAGLRGGRRGVLVAGGPGPGVDGGGGGADRDLPVRAFAGGAGRHARERRRSGARRGADVQPAGAGSAGIRRHRGVRQDRHLDRRRAAPGAHLLPAGPATRRCAGDGGRARGAIAASGCAGTGGGWTRAGR